jgi:hypothetical protein
MKIMPALVFALLISHTAMAGTEPHASKRIISGKVVDLNSGEEIAGAEIKIGENIIYTDLNGYFSTVTGQPRIEASVNSISYVQKKVELSSVSYETVVIELQQK